MVEANNQSVIDSVWQRVNTAKNPADVTASLIVLNELLITVDPDTTKYFFNRVTEITNKALKQHPDAITKKNLYINLAAVTSNLAYVDQLKGNYVSALNLFNKALAILKKYPRADYEGILLNNIGIIHLEMQDYDNALYY
jgi:tetratricopeptide (TPR) repeat protein